MRPGEQQVATSLDEIRADHTARYRWANAILAKPRVRGFVIDYGCGTGYGSYILAEEGGYKVHACDIDNEAIDFAKKHWRAPDIAFHCNKDKHYFPDECGAAVCFECIEHVSDPKPILKRLHEHTSTLLVSVPNEHKFPHRGKIKYHYRHYTPEQLERLLNATGWSVESWWGQEDAYSDVKENVQGRTLLAVCKRSAKPKGGKFKELEDVSYPRDVAIVAMGTSCGAFLPQAVSESGKLADEVWCINLMGRLVSHSLLFAMDDLRVQEDRAATHDHPFIPSLLEMLKTHPNFLTSREYPEYPGGKAYPLEEVLNCVQVPYFNTTAAYAVAYAIYKRVQKISLYGFDFVYRDAWKAERGRSCVELLLGKAMERDIHIVVPKMSSLLDSNLGNEHRFYGYDTQHVSATKDQETKTWTVELTDRTPSEIPSAHEIDKRYSFTNETALPGKERKSNGHDNG